VFGQCIVFDYTSREYYPSNIVFLSIEVSNDFMVNRMYVCDITSLYIIYINTFFLNSTYIVFVVICQQL